MASSIFKRRRAQAVLAEPYLRLDLPQITPAACARIAAAPDAVRDLAEAALPDLRRLLRPQWRERGLGDHLCIIATAVAHNLKPYGPGTLPDLASMLRADTLDCSNYGLLTHHLAARLIGTSDGVRMIFIGWDGGAVGSHQMVIVPSQGAGRDLVLDPVFGLAVLASFDQIASGAAVPAGDVIAVTPTAQLKDGRAHFARLLLEGGFRPSNLLYFFDGADHLLKRYGNPYDWPTPAAVILRSRRDGG